MKQKKIIIQSKWLKLIRSHTREVTIIGIFDLNWIWLQALFKFNNLELELSTIKKLPRQHEKEWNKKSDSVK